jgi:hypothetical protein
MHLARGPIIEEAYFFNPNTIQLRNIQVRAN